MGGFDLRAEYEAVLGPTVDRVVEALERTVSRARAAHPEYRTSIAAFVRHLAGIAGADAEAFDTLSTEHCGDLFLAFSCAEKDERAVAEFDRLLSRVAPPAIARLRLDPPRVDEILQRLRIRLAVGDGTNPPKILRYSGRSSLQGWVAVTAVNAAYSFVAERGERPWEEIDKTLTEVIGGGDPDLQALAGAHGDTLRDSIRAALDALADHERAVLRYSLLEGLSIDQIAAINGYDRATAARRIVRAKQNLRDRVQEEFCRRSGVTPSEFASITRDLYSLIDVSIERLLLGNAVASAGR